MSRRTRFALLSLLLLAPCAPGGARAGLPPTATQMILRQATSPRDLRARLLDYALATDKSSPLSAGEAWYWLGHSFARASRPDSAIACWERAMAVRGVPDERIALAEALLARAAPGDVDHSFALLDPAYREAVGENDANTARLRATLAWTELAAGRPTRAQELFAQDEESLTRYFRWRLRLAQLRQTLGDDFGVIQLLRPLAVASRGTAGDVMQMMQKSADHAGQSAALEKQMVELLGARDRIEERAIQRMSGRRIRFLASDSFPLSGVALIPASKSRLKPAIVMMSVQDTVADFDSLAAGLQRSGFAVLLLDARGSGWSVAPSCPLPEAWGGREEALIARSARDVRDAVRALAAAAKLDTSTVLLAACGDMVRPAAEAAAADRRVRALVLVSPDPDPVDRGVIPALLAKRPLPTYLQQTPEDFPNYEFTDMDLHAAAERYSRISDAHAAGSGAVSFRQDPKVSPRFQEWLKLALSAPPPPATPPAARH